MIANTQDQMRDVYWLHSKSDQSQAQKHGGRGSENELSRTTHKGRAVQYHEFKGGIDQF